MWSAWHSLRAPSQANRYDCEQAASRQQDWKRWGPYLSERQWGTVREDYSANGTAWEYFPHDHARSRAYRWGEDGLLGICDRQGRLCFAVALWNGRDPILKERLFGLTGNEGNHGEDVKECYYYLDSTPTHSYMKALYKYPQAAFPYAQLVDENRRRGRNEPEFELIDTGVFDDNRYFDVIVEYAKASPNDVLIRIEVAQPRARDGPPARAADAVVSQHLVVGTDWRRLLAEAAHHPRRRRRRHRRARHAGHIRSARRLERDGGPAVLFTENETNYARLFGAANPTAVREGRLSRLRRRMDRRER